MLFHFTNRKISFLTLFWFFILVFGLSYQGLAGARPATDKEFLDLLAFGRFTDSRGTTVGYLGAKSDRSIDAKVRGRYGYNEESCSYSHSFCKDGYVPVTEFLKFLETTEYNRSLYNKLEANRNQNKTVCVSYVSNSPEGSCIFPINYTPEIALTVELLPEKRTIFFAGQPQLFVNYLLPDEQGGYGRSLREDPDCKKLINSPLLNFEFEMSVSDFSVCSYGDALKFQENLNSKIQNIATLYTSVLRVFDQNVVDKGMKKGDRPWENIFKCRLIDIENLCRGKLFCLNLNYKYDLTKTIYGLQPDLLRALNFSLLGQTLTPVEGGARCDKSVRNFLEISCINCFRNIQIMFRDALPNKDDWISRIEEIRKSESTIDLKRFLFSTALCNISFNPKCYEEDIKNMKGVLFIQENFFENLFLAEHANPKHLVSEEKTSRVKFNPEKTLTLEDKARILSHSLCSWIMDSDVPVSIEKAGRQLVDYNVYLKVSDLAESDDIQGLIYCDPNTKIPEPTDTIKISIQALLNSHTLVNTYFPESPRKVSDWWGLDKESNERTLFDVLSERNINLQGKDSIFENINIKDLMLILLGKTMQICGIDQLGTAVQTYEKGQVTQEMFESLFGQPQGINEIFVISDGVVNEITLSPCASVPQ